MRGNEEEKREKRRERKIGGYSRGDWGVDEKKTGDRKEDCRGNGRKAGRDRENTGVEKTRDDMREDKRGERLEGPKAEEIR